MNDSDRSLRVEMRFKNAVLFDAIERQFGHARRIVTYRNNGVVKHAARAMGVSYGMLSGYLRLQVSPYSVRDGKLLKKAAEIAEKLGLHPDEAFPPELYSGLFKNPLVQIVSPARFLPLSAREARLLRAPEDLEEEAARREHIELVRAALQFLSERDREILTGRYGIDEKTFREIANGHGRLTTERIHQIHDRALARLKWLLSHPREVWSEKAAADGGAVLLQKKRAEARLRGER